MSTTIQEELEGKKGQPGGIASLDEAGKVPAEQLPSYVDDVIEGFMTETVTGPPPRQLCYPDLRLLQEANTPQDRSRCLPDSQHNHI